MFHRLIEAKNILMSNFNRVDYAIITGTGIDITLDCDNKMGVDYSEIANMPKPTTLSHKGFFELCQKGNKNILLAHGRFHYYEEYSMEDVIFLPRLLGLTGAKIVILTNAAGGLRTYFNEGDLMVINDHVNMMGVSPLKGKNIAELGDKFPDMSEPYSTKYIKLLKKVAIDSKIELSEGVYIGVAGPSMETPAETRFFRMIGGDAIGMSTVPEVIALNHMGVPCIAISIISNVNKPDCMGKVPLENVIEVAKYSSIKLSRLINNFLKVL